MNGNAQFNLKELKLPPDWELMEVQQQEHFMQQNGQEPNNIITFPDPRRIDLNDCF